jgi:DNA-binding Xre family transcriptional regulator
VRVRHILHQDDIGQGGIELRVGDLCRDRKITVNRLASLTGLTRPTCYALFRGTASALRLDTIARLCYVFRVSPNVLMRQIPDRPVR